MAMKISTHYSYHRFQSISTKLHEKYPSDGEILVVKFAGDKPIVKNNYEILIIS